MSRFVEDTENPNAITITRKTEKSITKSVPGPQEVERALSRLAILPNPADPELNHPEKYVESPWKTTTPPTIDPNIWDNATTQIVQLADLTGTDLFLKRKRVAKHIENMGQAMTPYRSFALVVETQGNLVIVDGHHRLMSWWLLGQTEAPVWKVKL